MAIDMKVVWVLEELKGKDVTLNHTDSGNGRKEELIGQLTHVDSKLIRISYQTDGRRVRKEVPLAQIDSIYHGGKPVYQK
jgi:hypothetical protein